MNKLVIQGPAKLTGDVWIPGAKNAALPILAATILCDSGCVIHRVPHLRDVTSMLSLLGCLGFAYSIDDRLSVKLERNEIKTTIAPADLVQSMRASILVLGPLVAKYGHAAIANPGGCDIGARPIGFHLDVFRKMGATVEYNKDRIDIKATRLTGCAIEFERESVTGTENAIMAAVLADGVTTINNAACEPEVGDLCAFLNACGAKISGCGTKLITIEGVDALKHCEHTLIADRIETGTMLIAAAMSQGHVRLHDCDPEHLDIVLDLLKKAGADITVSGQTIELRMNQRPKAVSLVTGVYPGVPTDLQAQFMTMNAIADGESVVEETIFENRFQHVEQLRRMGANIDLNDNIATVKGVESLHGAKVAATDLRASAALIIAAINAYGHSELVNIEHVDRGYAHIEEKFSALGACIYRAACETFE